MIKVYPVKIEAVDEDGSMVFSMETQDSHAAMVKINAFIGHDNFEELVAAMRRAVQMLELE